MRNIYDIRVFNARELAKKFATRSEFAEKLNKEATQVSRFMGRKPTKKIGDSIAEQIEVAFKKPKGWLDIDHDFLKQENIINTVQHSGMIPLINWVQAGSWSDIAQNFQQGDAEEHYPCPERHSDTTFALKVIGESMYPDFIPGEIIYVDPEVEATSGSCVVVQQNGDTEATFKQLMLDGSKKYLKALNPNWPNPIIEMKKDATICGVVIGSYRKRN